MAEVVVDNQDTYFVVAGAGVQRGALVTPDAAVTFRGRASLVTRIVAVTLTLMHIAPCYILNSLAHGTQGVVVQMNVFHNIHQREYRQQCTFS